MFLTHKERQMNYEVLQHCIQIMQTTNYCDKVKDKFSYTDKNLQTQQDDEFDKHCIDKLKNLYLDTIGSLSSKK